VIRGSWSADGIPVASGRVWGNVESMSRTFEGTRVPQVLPDRAEGTFLDRVDPRTRVIAALLFSLVVTFSNQLLTLGLALGMTVAGAICGGQPLRSYIPRLASVNLLLLILGLLLVFSGGDAQGVSRGLFVFSPERLPLAVAIAVKANALVLGVMVLLGGLSSVTLAHALGHLGVPQKLTHLLLFTIRYLDVLQREYQRLRSAMTTRGFRPAVNRHTYRTFGYLVGMLLVRSSDRSERIIAAMKCRGFSGRFFLLDELAFSGWDIAFLAALLLGLVGLVVTEWL
jgi:cobalt/nickel transport system permease protein